MVFLNPPTTNRYDLGRVDKLPARARLAFASYCARVAANAIQAFAIDEQDYPSAQRVLDACDVIAAGHRDALDLAAGPCLRQLKESQRRFYLDGELGWHAQDKALAAIECAVNAATYLGSYHSRDAVFWALETFRIPVFNKTRDDVAGHFYSVLTALLHSSSRERWSDRTAVDPAKLSPDCAGNEVAHIMQEASIKLCQHLATAPASLGSLEWRQVEQVVATALEGLGFFVELTPPSRDGGKDVIAYCLVRGRIRTYYIEIKHWRDKRVSLPPLKSFSNVVARDNVDGALFLSTSGFTEQVIRDLSLIAKQRVHLGSDRKLLSLCQAFVQAQVRPVWLPQDALPQVLTVNTLTECFETEDVNGDSAARDVSHD